MSTKALIQRLKGDLEPTKILLEPQVVTIGWLLCSLIYVGTLVSLLGPLRPGVGDQLLSHPRFSLEMLTGLFAFGALACAAFISSIPGLPTRWLIRVGLALGLFWLFQIVSGFMHPALEPSMLGKREHCALEAYLYSVPPVIAAIWIQRRRYPLDLVQTALLSALAAGLLPALAMQIACMYETVHALKFHILPIGIIAGFAGLWALLLRWRDRRRLLNRFQ